MLSIGFLEFRENRRKNEKKETGKKSISFVCLFACLPHYQVLSYTVYLSPLVIYLANPNYLVVATAN